MQHRSVPTPEQACVVLLVDALRAHVGLSVRLKHDADGRPHVIVTRAAEPESQRPRLVVPAANLSRFADTT
uniref:hypothetical protein n=1 Tax=Nonomuraea sp. CA-251285 TaxID=3240002 RepID=UPI003F492515